MEKCIFFILFSCLFVKVFGQEVSHVKSQKWEGYIFPKEFPIWGLKPEENRYTLNNEDIHLVEEVLGVNTIFLYNDNYIKKKVKLKNYYRQYVGYINSDNHIIVEIRFIHRSECSINIAADIVSVCDGGDRYFDVKVDLTDKKIIKINQNGLG